MLHLDGSLLQKFHRSHLDVILKVFARYRNACAAWDDLNFSLSDIYGKTLVLNALSELLID